MTHFAHELHLKLLSQEETTILSRTKQFTIFVLAKSGMFITLIKNGDSFGTQFSLGSYCYGHTRG